MTVTPSDASAHGTSNADVPANEARKRQLVRVGLDDVFTTRLIRVVQGFTTGQRRLLLLLLLVPLPLQLPTSLVVAAVVHELTAICAEQSKQANKAHTASQPRRNTKLQLESARGVAGLCCTVLLLQRAPH